MARAGASLPIERAFDLVLESVGVALHGVLFDAAPPVTRVELVEDVRTEIAPPADTILVQDMEELVGDERLAGEVLGIVGAAGEVDHLVPRDRPLLEDVAKDPGYQRAVRVPKEGELIFGEPWSEVAACFIG